MDYFPNHYKTQEKRESFISKDPFLLQYCPDRYKTMSHLKKVLVIVFRR